MWNKDAFQFNRRHMLQRTALGFGALAAQDLLSRNLAASEENGSSELANLPMTVKPHFRPRARRVIFLFMHGGPSQVDLFDPKPALTKYSGNKLPFAGSRVTFAQRGSLMASPWKFRPCGDSGLPMSELWQHLPQVADELCMLHSVCETNVSHGGACMKIHTGDESQVKPSLGSWVSYGLGNENQDLPSFITICPTSLHGGVNNFGSAFLPQVHSGVPLGTPGYPNAAAKNARFGFLENNRRTLAQQAMQLRLLRRLQEERSAYDSELEDRLESFELAFRMQNSAPEATDLSQESDATLRMYGMDDPETENFARECLLARRFAERGVRFVQVSHAHSLPFNNEQWDQHSHLVKGHSTNVRQIDKPITALLLDLKRRGMLNDTLVLWGGEFGRTPTVQVGNAQWGRDHHTEGFTMWMAGGGVKGGCRYGATDDFGYYATENRCTIHDLHATILHILGLDHTRLTWSHNGRDIRLTDVHGDVAEEILI
ncbi:MAG: DUF1501 domain-containing protein [Planctomycetota bacterium]